MPSEGDVHTVPHGDGWANEAEGNERVSRTSDTKAEAEEKGRELAQHKESEHLIHNKDGKIAERNTYPRERDPRDIPG